MRADVIALDMNDWNGNHARPQGFCGGPRGSWPSHLFSLVD